MENIYIENFKSIFGGRTIVYDYVSKDVYSCVQKYG